MTKTRLYTFGCSYTNFWWPTWVDYLGTLFDETYNFGKSGGGNWLNFHSFSNLIGLNQIKRNDTVVIQWSSLLREIRFWNGASSPFTPGNILNSPFPKDDFVYKYFNPVQKGFELISYITTVKHVCKSRGINLKMFYMYEPWTAEFLGEPTNIDDVLDQWTLDLHASGIFNKLRNLYEDSFVKQSLEDFNLENSIKSCYSVQDGFDPIITGEDHHPSPLAHFKYTNKYLLDWAINLPSSKYRLNRKNTTVEKIKVKIAKELFNSAKLWTDKLSSKSFITKIYDISTEKYQSNVCLNYPHDMLNYTDELSLPEILFGNTIHRNGSILSTHSKYTALLGSF